MVDLRKLGLILIVSLSASAATAVGQPAPDDALAAYCFGLWQALKSQPGHCEAPAQSGIEACEVTAAAFQARMNLATSYLQARGREIEQFPKQVKQAGADRFMVRVDPQAADRMRRCEGLLTALPAAEPTNVPVRSP